MLLISTFFLLIISIFSSRPYININPFLGFMHFCGFYLLGIFINKIDSKITKINRLTISTILIFSLSGFIILLIYYGGNFKLNNSYISFGENLGTFNPVQFGKFFLLIFVFILLFKFYNKKYKILSYLAEISFGLFFVHGFYMLIFSKYFSTIISDGLFRLIFEFILVIPCSIATVYVLKLILKTRSKYVIGC